MNEFVRLAVVLLGAAFDAFSTMLFYNACLGKKNIRVSRRVFVAAFALPFAADWVINQFLPDGLLNMLKAIILFMFLSLFYNSKWISRFFTALSMLVIGMIAELVSYGIVGAVIENTSFENVKFYTLMLSKMIIFILAVTVMLIVRKNTQKLSSKDYLYFIVTPIISIATVILISFEFDTGELKATLGICMAAAGLMAINIVVYFLLENIIEANEIREKQSRMEQQFAFQEQKYEQASQSFKSIGSIIHDTNKHLVYLNECLERREYDEAKNYIGTAIEHIDKSYKRINTGFLPVDALVSNSLNIAEYNNIKFKSDIKIEKERINIERYDFCVALGNLLDNAVEAARKVINPDDRYISVSIITADNSLIINIENSSERTAEPGLKTDKKNVLLHGYGINNVKAISEKYGGVFTIERKESSCEATLIFPA